MVGLGLIPSWQLLSFFLVLAASMVEDFYKILGVRWNATDDQIGKAYRALVRLYHPDINHEPGAFEKFQVIQKAFEVLSDPVKRAAFNQTRSKSVAPPAQGVYNPNKFHQTSNSRNLYKPIKICAAVMVMIIAIFSLIVLYSNNAFVNSNPDFYPDSTGSISFTKSDETYKSDFKDLSKPLDGTRQGSIISPYFKGYVSKKDLDEFHKVKCGLAPNYFLNDTIYYKTRDEAINAGKKPCSKCNP